MNNETLAESCRQVPNSTSSKQCDENTTKQIMHSSLPSSDLDLFYSVVWGKISTKKHKTFEGDGTLTVSNKTATLRNIDGSHLGSRPIKSEDIEIGSRLIIGSNEIEIIERTTEVQLPLKRKTDDNDTEEAQVKKKPKSNPSFFQPYLNVSNSVRGNCSPRMNFDLYSRKDYIPLIMPQPTNDHQLKFNPSNRMVKEVSINPCCARELRPHQREGVHFIYECIMGFRSIENLGCILADEMVNFLFIQNLIYFS